MIPRPGASGLHLLFAPGQGVVERLHAALTERAYDVWVDREDIPPRAEWFAEIEAGIRGADLRSHQLRRRDGPRLAGSRARAPADPAAVAGRWRGGRLADSVQFSPDGRYLVAGAAIGAYVWRLRDFSVLPPSGAEPGPGPYVGGGRGYSAGITSDGQTLFVTGNNNDEAWSLAEHRQLLHAFPVAIGGGGAIDLAGTRMLAANGGGLSLYACPLCGGLPRLLAATRTRITRSLTAAEGRPRGCERVGEQTDRHAGGGPGTDRPEDRRSGSRALRGHPNRPTGRTYNARSGASCASCVISSRL